MRSCCVTCATAELLPATLGLPGLPKRAGLADASADCRVPVMRVFAREWFSWRGGFLSSRRRVRWLGGNRQRTADGRVRTRIAMIVALARKLLIALWRMVRTGEMPDG